ncbi:HAD family hydrolase [Floricoccus penangensis]|uniref:HAD family hydrolase n=1 Tax=Floricoccus penangensis TaxID=1859475 RepID=A0A9Q5JFI7_9LACT|nr:HAD-IA family hydrolase [Floricoccus penangensis]OFI46360.1 HAD family hydrolase [Floricoccus penangensis]
MNNKNFIWDLDGTLLDSYPTIIESLFETYQHFDLDFDKEYVSKFIIDTSVKDLFNKLSSENNISFDELKKYFTNTNNQKNDMIVLMPGALEVLDYLSDNGSKHFVYTHKGRNAYDVLDSLGIGQFFKEVITSDNGFIRKPHPEGIDYLVEKYNLDRADTYYVGDRTLDYEVAINSGIKSINFIVPNNDINKQISSLKDIEEMF